MELLALPGAVRPGAPELVDAATLARRLGVSRDYVYRHADELGARPVGGARGRGRLLRFDPDVALASATGRRRSGRSQGPANAAGARRQSRRSAAATPAPLPLLPIAGEEVPR